MQVSLSIVPAALVRRVAASLISICRLLIDERLHLVMATIMVMIQLRDVAHVVNLSTDYRTWLSLTISGNVLFWSYWWVRSWRRIGSSVK